MRHIHLERCYVLPSAAVDLQGVLCLDELVIRIGGSMRSAAVVGGRDILLSLICHFPTLSESRSRRLS
jgi:hypothetical protein